MPLSSYDLGGNTLRGLHRYQAAVESYSRSLGLAPDVAATDGYRGWTWVEWQGRLDSARAALDRHAPDADVVSPGTVRAQRACLLLYERKSDSLLALRRGAPQTAFDGQDLYLPTVLYAAWAYQLRDERTLAHAAFDSARVFLDSVLVAIPDDWRVHAARGLALAGLGWREEARREAQWLEQSAIYREDAMDGVLPAEDRACILAAIGERDAALEEIERLLAGRSLLSVHTLRLDPRWDPIRDDPRFQALLHKDDPPRPVPLN
jgi:tetratricopeptide (TPR) repeat protein